MSPHLSREAFHARVLNTVARWNMLPDGARVGVAVSGGADSVAMLHTLHALAGQYGWVVSVLHVNHQLRGEEAEEDARFVEALARQLDLPCQIVNLPVDPAGNLEQKARKARYAWFRSCLKSASLQGTGRDLNGLTRIALGHTRSDQAETVLFRLLRGSGAAGLAGIRPVLDGGMIVRPLFKLTREDAREYLRAIGQPFRDDSSNVDLSFDRNRIRLELLPRLAREWNPAIENTLAQMAEWARAEEEHWDGVLPALSAECLQTAADGAVLAETRALCALSTAALRRLIRHIIAQVRGDLHSIDFQHVEMVRALTWQVEGAARLQIPGVDVLRSFEWIRFAPPGSYAGDRHFSVPVAIPGEFILPPANCTLTLQVENADYRYNEDVNCADAQSISGPLTLRTWQPGDRYCPQGRSEAQKIKALFQTARIPLWERRGWPVLAMDEEIVWSRRFGVAAAYAARHDSHRVVRISESPDDKVSTVSSKPESGARRHTSIEGEGSVVSV